MLQTLDQTWLCFHSPSRQLWQKELAGISDPRLLSDFLLPGGRRRVVGHHLAGLRVALLPQERTVTHGAGNR